MFTFLQYLLFYLFFWNVFPTIRHVIMRTILLFSNWVWSPSTRDRTQWEKLDVIILHVLYYNVFFLLLFPRVSGGWL